MSRHLLISTGHEIINLSLIHLYSALCVHETFNFTLIRPYSTLWTHMWCPGIDWSALDMRHLIWPWFTLIQPCGPVCDVQALTDQHWTWDNWFGPYLPLFNLVAHIWCPGINWSALDMRHSIWPLFTLIQPWFTLIRSYSTLWTILMSRHWLIRTGHETFNLALICPYSTLWTCMWCPGIDWPALDYITSAQRMVTLRM